MNKFFTGLYHLLWYTAAVVLILAAILVTALRLALPGIGSYKSEIQSWVSNYMDYPVVIYEINAEWKGWVPHLHLQEIDLYDRAQDKLIAHFAHARLSIDPLASIWQGEIVPQQLAISGLKLDLIRRPNGAVSIRNQSDSSENLQEGNSALAVWLLNQRSIVLEDSSISWKDEKEALPVRHFEKVRLSIKSDEDRRQLDISMMLPEEYGKSLSFNMDITGNPLEPDWSGDIFIEAIGIVGDELLKNRTVRARNTANRNCW